MADFWIILTGSLVAICCGLLGCFLILRKMAMVGDAISHAVLPGIVIAFLIMGGRNEPAILIGAGLVGLLSTFLIEVLNSKIKLQSDAAIGVIFTFLFSVGVVLISAYAGQVDLDQDCILYGEITYVPLDVWLLADGTDLGPTAIWVLSFVLILILLALAAWYRPLFLTTFDPEYAAAIGISTAFFHYLLMALVSLTTVASFESVGAILVVAFIIVPPATAYLLTDSFPRMLILTCILGVLISASGYYLAYLLDASVAGAMVTVAGFYFALAFLFAPNTGLITRKLKHRTESLELSNQ